MADYNVAALITDVLDKAKEPNFSRSRVLTYLQRAQDGVLGRHRFKFSEQSLTETLNADATTYSYDCDHQQIFQVVLSHDDAADPIQPAYIAHADFFARFPLPDTEEATSPSFYTDYGGELYWNAPLDRAYTLDMKYIAASSRLEDTDTCTPDLPQEFDSIYVASALAGIEAYRENHDIAAVHRRTVEELEEDLLGRYALRKVQPGKARTTRRRVVWR